MSISFINYFVNQVALISIIPGSVGADDTSMTIVLGTGRSLGVPPGTVTGIVVTYLE